MLIKVYKLQSLVDRLALKLGFAPALLARVVVGYAFFYTGRGKLGGGKENFLQLLKDAGIPLPELQAPFIAHLEYYGGMLLVLGLGCRLISALLSSTLVVALLTADRSSLLATFSWNADSTPLDVTPVPFLLPLTWLVVYGAGAVSLDKLVSWFIQKRVDIDQNA